MKSITDKFLNILESRTQENRETISLLVQNRHLGNAISTLRQEIDTFVRVVYLATMEDLSYREHLMECTIKGEKWTEKGKKRKITDREMVDIANRLKGYVQYAYKFGCSFIHLSDSHDYKNVNPFASLSMDEQNNIAFYLNYYHGYPTTEKLSINSISRLIPNIFDKISNNMLCYTKHLVENTVLVD